MKYLLPFITFIVTAFLAGVVFAAIVTISVVFLMAPGVAKLLGAVLIPLAVIIKLGIVNVTLIIGLVFVVVCAGAYYMSQEGVRREKRKQETLLERTHIKGTNYYEDQHGMKWEKVAGIYKQVNI